MKLVNIKDIPSKEDVKEADLEDPVKLLKIFKDMENLCNKKNGIGLSAVQVGIPLRMFIVKIDKDSKLNKLVKNNFIYCLNMEYHYPTDSDNYIISLEGCLSIRSLDGQLRHFQVPRFKNINLNGFFLKDTKFIELSNFELNVDDQSIVFQHEIDHQFGITIDQIGKEIFLW